MSASAMRVRSVVGFVATVTCVTAAQPTYTDARCPNCNRMVLAVPGVRALQSRTVTSTDEWSGRGVVAVCKRCGTYVEVIAHP